MLNIVTHFDLTNFDLNICNRASTDRNRIAAECGVLKDDNQLKNICSFLHFRTGTQVLFWFETVRSVETANRTAMIGTAMVRTITMDRHSEPNDYPWHIAKLIRVNLQVDAFAEALFAKTQSPRSQY